MKKLFFYYTVLMLCAASYGARYALLVGNSYGGAFAPLKYVQNDILGMRDVLSQFCGFEKENIVSLYNRSSKELGAYLNSLPGRLSSEDDVFLFYYTGHADLENLLMGNTKYPLADLKKQVKSYSTQMRIVIFDACQSGCFTRIKGGSLQEPFLYKEESNIEGQVVIYSSSANEYSQESDLYKNSIFTFHFLNGLRGCADISGDKRISLAEAYQYSYSRTVSSTAHTTGGVQHPGYQFNIQGEGNVILSDINTRTCGIILDESVGGNLVILDVDDNLTADLVKQEKNRLFIALNPGNYRIVKTRDDEAFKAKVFLNENQILPVTKEQFHKMRTTPVYAKGAPDRKFTVGVAVSGGFMQFGLHDLARQCNNRFTGYSQFTMRPEFSFQPINMQGGLGIEFNFRNGLQAYACFDYCRTRNEQSYNGFTKAPGDTLKYGVSLKIRDTLTTGTFTTGIGYTFKNRYFRFISVRLGADVVFADFTIGSVFSDSLYHLETSNSFADRGVLVLPRASASLRYNFRESPFSIGVNSGYRYLPVSQELHTKERIKTPLEYDFSGISVSAFLLCVLNRM